MAILKCKMCGGDIEVSPDKTCGVCECCGTTMTFPKLDDEQRAATFNRGNHFRRIGEFDKALSAYEQIVREDDTDAEAHWCCALCRFGIEYVEDPATLEYIPTCHRASFDSFLEDVDYLAALNYSDGITKRQYQKDAMRIADVQRGILATSQNEEPFDVFICYKETDGNGERTRDSLMAQDIYYQLTEQGLRVFFARITLEDKVGAEYEPYIFAALHSAKVMVAVGTTPEHFNAVWVKNEWSRFIALMKKDRSKLLIPCYRDMDPYDLPEQLSVLQSYDMSKIGFIQDLIRGIQKVTANSTPKADVKETIVLNHSEVETAPLLKRAFMFLEDGDWERADEFCEQVLNMNPECAEAYLGKLMAELRCAKQADLKNQAKPFDDSNNYEKVIRFGAAKLKTELDNSIKFIYYRQAKSAMDAAKTENEFKHAAELFRAMTEYEDSAAQAEKCIELAEIARKNAIYDATMVELSELARKDALYDAIMINMADEQISSYENAIQRLKPISSWKDVDQQIINCQSKIQEIKEKAEQERLEKEHQEELHRQEAEKRKKKAKKITMIVTLIVCVCIAFVIVLQIVLIPSQKLKKADALIESGDYDTAYALLKEIERNDVIIENKYDRSLVLIESGDYMTAYELLDGLNYKDSEEKLQEIAPKYYKALNSDTVGWLEIPGTDIDNSVLQSNDNEYYLCRNEKKEYSIHGCYFADYECNIGARDVLSPNTIIYGKSDSKDNPDGPRFSQLFSFTNEDFARNAPYVYFSSEEDYMVWQIFAVFYTDTKMDYICVNIPPEKQAALVQEGRDKSLYDYDVTVEDTDRILCLSTSSIKYGGRPDERFVVMAKLLPANAELSETASLAVNPDPLQPSFTQ